MNVRLSNQLHMLSSCLSVAQDAKYKTVWSDKQPLAFGNGMALLQTGYTALTKKASEAESASGGEADAKAVAETALEENAYLLARALAVHFRSTGDVARRAKVDFSRSGIVRLRENDLIATAISIRDIGAVAVNEPKAEEHGVTAELVEATSTSIDRFSSALSTPRGKIVSRSTLLKEMETDMAGLITVLGDLDDLVLQFNKTPAGRSFIEAWNGARIIIDRAASFSPKPTPAPTPAPVLTK